MLPHDWSHACARRQRANERPQVPIAPRQNYLRPPAYIGQTPSLLPRHHIVNPNQRRQPSMMSSMPQRQFHQVANPSTHGQLLSGQNLYIENMHYQSPHRQSSGTWNSVNQTLYGQISDSHNMYGQNQCRHSVYHPYLYSGNSHFHPLRGASLPPTPAIPHQQTASSYARVNSGYVNGALDAPQQHPSGGCAPSQALQAQQQQSPSCQQTFPHQQHRCPFPNQNRQQPPTRIYHNSRSNLPSNTCIWQQEPPVRSHRNAQTHASDHGAVPSQPAPARGPMTNMKRSAEPQDHAGSGKRAKATTSLITLQSQATAAFPARSSNELSCLAAPTLRSTHNQRKLECSPPIANGESRAAHDSPLTPTVSYAKDDRQTLRVPSFDFSTNSPVSLESRLSVEGHRHPTRPDTPLPNDSPLPDVEHRLYVALKAWLAGKAQAESVKSEWAGASTPAVVEAKLEAPSASNLRTSGSHSSTINQVPYMDEKTEQCMKYIGNVLDNGPLLSGPLTDQQNRRALLEARFKDMKERGPAFGQNVDGSVAGEIGELLAQRRKWTRQVRTEGVATLNQKPDWDRRSVIELLLLS